MSDTVYKVHKYTTFKVDEFISLLLTSVFVALIVSMHDLLFVSYGESNAIMRCVLMFVFLFCALTVTVWISKIIAARLGYVITYRAHMLGLLVGAIIAFMSQGWLPVFLPGGFVYDQPDRLRVGKWRPLRKGWETGVISASFPLLLLLFIVLLSPLYIASNAMLLSQFMVAICLLAIFSLVPFAFIERDRESVKFEWYRYLKGSTFGLDVLWASRFWYLVLVVTVLLYAVIAWIFTYFGIIVDIVVYVLCFFFTLLLFWIYNQFFK